MKGLVFSSSANMVVKCDIPNASFDKTDSVHFQITFHPPLDLNVAKQTFVTVDFDGRGIGINKDGTVGDRTTQHERKPALQCRLFSKRVYQDRGGVPQLDGQYMAFCTHVVKVDKIVKSNGSSAITSSSTVVSEMYLGISNNKLTTFKEYASYLLQPDIDTHLDFLPERIRMVSLQWYPPNADLSKVQASSIPQRSPAWHALRAISNGRSGSGISLLFGYNLPKSKKEREGWTFENRNKMPVSEWSRQAMRKGTLGEDRLLLINGTVNPHQVFHECGWYDNDKIFPSTHWGASPDGLLFDASIEVPQETKDAYPDLDHTWGALEMKTSTKKNTMEPYYIPQVYWEMIVLNVSWCILMRNHKQESYSEGKYHYRDQVHAYLIFRDPVLESNMLNLAVKTYERVTQGKEDLLKIAEEPLHKGIRNILDTMAKEMKPYQCIDVANEPLVGSALEDYYKYMYRHMQPEAEVPEPIQKRRKSGE
jgi:hypothetical protein